MGLDMYVIKRKKGEAVDARGFEEVLYWRKANAIHKWFVDNVQNGEDNCGYYEVTKEQIIKLKNICQEVLNKINVTEGQVVSGQTFRDGNWTTNYENGRIITNPEVAKELLPTTSGCFFGSTDYDEYYIEDLEETVKKIDSLLETFDFENDYLVYTSSW